MSGPTFDNLPWDRRWSLAASCVGLAIAVLALISVEGKPWRWDLFIWGVVVGLAGLTIILAIFAWAVRRDPPSRTRRMDLRHRLIILSLSWVVIGLLAGSLSAGLALPEVDWVAAAMAAASFLAGGITALIVLQRRRRSTVQ